MEEGGAKRIVVIIAVVAVAAIGVFWYWQRAKQRALGSGKVYVKTPAPGQSPDQTKDQSAWSTAAAAGSATPPQSDDASQTAPVPASAQSASKPSATVEKSAAHPMPSARPAVTQPRGALEVPASDTIPRNPPSGLIFAGSGKYQLYRQGDITWRLDTDNGRACIIFATDNQWSRVRVWDQGCGAS